MDRLAKLVRKQENIYRVHELVDNVVTGVNSNSRFLFNEALIKRLHSVAMQGLLESPGEYRTTNVAISNSPHVCPNWIEVPNLMATLCEYVNVNWDSKNLLHLSAFVMWRLNWIHPFPNGNGRTSRATAYMVLCAKHGQLLPPKNTIIEQIQANKDPYYQLLRHSDEIYKRTSNVDEAIKDFEDFLTKLLLQQLRSSMD